MNETSREKVNKARTEATRRFVEARSEGFPDYEEKAHQATWAIAAKVAAAHGLTLREFDRMCGFSARGYQGILRSQRNLHYVAAKPPTERRDALRVFRQQARTAFQQERKRVAAVQ
jgi:hypothetical protein